MPARCACSLAIILRCDDRNLQGILALKRRYAAPTVSVRSARIHLAIRSGPTFTLGGRCSTQRASTNEQRVANEQLPGALSSEAGVPGIVSSRCPRLARRTVAASTRRPHGRVGAGPA